MRGTYRFYKNGELVAVQPNVITTEGRKMITRYLAGSISSWAGSIAVGSDATAAAVGNTQLGFEFGRADIQMRSPRLDTNQVVFRATMPDALSGYIYETGVFNLPDNAMTAFPRRVLTTFNDTIQTIDGAGTTVIFNASSNPIYARAGQYSRRLTTAISGTESVYVRNLGVDLSGYRTQDSITLAAYYVNTNATLNIRLQSDDSNYFSATFASPGTGYRLLTATKSVFSTTGSPSWSNIKEIRIINTAPAGGASDVYLDAISVDDKTSYPEYALVSRTVLGSPIFKGFNEQLDVEYAVELL